MLREYDAVMLLAQEWELCECSVYVLCGFHVRMADRLGIILSTVGHRMYASLYCHMVVQSCDNCLHCPDVWV